MKNINLISISGRMGSGKNAVASMIQEITAINGESKWEQKAFAGKLKQIASILTGISVEKFEDQDFKKSLLGEEWGIVKNNPLNSVGPFENIKFLHLMSVREFLQKLGTDGLREGLHEEVWVNALFADWIPTISPLKARRGNSPSLERYPPSYPSWIITDCRFPNELQAVKDRGGFTIRLTRNSDVHSDHISETALDEVEFDYVIDNKNQTLEETFCSVVKMIDEFKIG